MKKKIKCGGYTLQDGVITKNPNRSFKTPRRMPDYLKDSYARKSEDESLVFSGLTLGEYLSDCDKIDEMNALRESNWKNGFKKQYNTLEWAYFLGDLSKRSPRFIRPFLLKKRKALIEALVTNEHSRGG